jgi:fermentation-respiration switch protein FrsA (DUF1100 family)
MLFLKLGLASVGLLYVAAVAGMVTFQRDLQYFPDRSDPAPDAVGLRGVDRIALPTADGENVVLWVSPPVGNRPTILYFHGNAGSIADRADRLAFYQSRGFGAAFLSWRGYGGSTGHPTEAGLMLDAEAAYAYLATQGIAADQIVLLGESLGTGVAVQLAARHKTAAVILEAPYTAAVDIAAQAYPWLPVRALMLDQFLSRNHIAQIDAPLLILHGERDRVIPYRSGQRLFDQAQEPKAFVSLGPKGHEALYEPATWALGADFIDATFPP